jgi:hypothetical protein
MRHSVALPWATKAGSLPPWAWCGSQAAGVFVMIGRRRAAWKVHSCAGVPSVVAGWLWTVEAAY